MDYIVDSAGLPGYIFPYLIGYLLIFYYSQSIIDQIRRINFTVNLTQFVIVNAIGLLLFSNDLFDKSGFIAYLIGMLCAASFFSFLMNICSRLTSYKLIIWLSGISFEIYLVHEFFLGRHSIYNMIDNKLIGIILLITLSIFTAVILKFISSLPFRALTYLKEKHPEISGI